MNLTKTFVKKGLLLNCCEFKELFEFNQYIKSEIIPHTNYADIIYLVKKQITVKII